MARTSRPKQVGALSHGEKRVNIPTAEMQSFFQREEDHSPLPPKHYQRQLPLAEGEHRERDPDRDPQLLWNGMRITLTEAQRRQLADTGEIEIGEAQLVWRGKDNQDWSDLIVRTPPLYIQEKIHPKAIIDDLRRRSAVADEAASDQPSLFADFNGVPRDMAAEFYQHEANWSNRMICGDSLAVMASLAERERLKGRVQCIYFDPPYGIRFNSNWQVSTRTRNVKDGRQTDISREPEQVKAFRDTWKDGIHSYLTYLRDRLTVARDLLTESGSIFVQIGDENVHRVRSVMDEVFGAGNFISQITLTKAASQSSELLASVNDFILWYSRNLGAVKYRTIYQDRKAIERPEERYICVEMPDGRIHDLSYNQKTGREAIPDGRYVRMITVTSQTGSETSRFLYSFRGQTFRPPGARGWSTNMTGLQRVERADRMWSAGTTLMWKNYHADYPYRPRVSLWDDIRSSGFGFIKTYVVQTLPEVVQRCILMATDPGDLVLDPTCGSGTTAYVGEQWGRRWITIDTSRVALALARTRLMAARYPWYLLADSPEGRRKEAELMGKPPLEDALHGPTRNDLRQGFVYERVPHITLKSIANNSRIDDIWEKWQAVLEPLRASLNAALGRTPAVIPGRGDAASPEPMNTAGSEGAPANVPQYPPSVFMGSGPGASHRPGMTEQSDGAWEEWEIPREAGADWPERALDAHKAWWQARIARQQEIDAGDRPGRRCRKALRPPLCRQWPGQGRRPVHGREPVAAPHRRDR